MIDKKNYLISTADGTSTLFLGEYDQAMHSDSGAYEESLLKHIAPSEVLNLVKNEISVLDIGFGLGYNPLALIHRFSLKKKLCRLRIISLEKERSLSPFMEKIKFNDERDEIYSFIKDAYRDGYGEKEGVSLEILFGDAREHIRNLKGFSFDAVFQDPFSPSKNPEMWSVEYFESVYKLMTEKAILTTYSSADHVRMAMLEAGFKVGAGPSVGRKREGTIASKSDGIEQLSTERLNEIRGNLKSEPYRDRGLSHERNVILSDRLERIRSRKGDVIR